MPGFDEPLLRAKPSNGRNYTQIELNAIWDIPTPNVITEYEATYQFHNKAVEKFNDFTAAGWNDRKAVDLIIRAVLAEDADPDPLEPPAWPCIFDHTNDPAHVAEFAEDGWIHGDPDLYEN